MKLDDDSYNRVTQKSHPTWVRGLKLALSLVPVLILKSHPTWVRGLKHVAEVFVGVACVSHPTWVRGLKPVFKLDGVEIFSVAPYVGAWIETFYI